MPGPGGRGRSGREESQVPPASGLQESDAAVPSPPPLPPPSRVVSIQRADTRAARSCSARGLLLRGLAPAAPGHHEVMHHVIRLASLPPRWLFPTCPLLGGNCVRDACTPGIPVTSSSLLFVLEKVRLTRGNLML